MPTTPAGVTATSGSAPRCRVVLEVGTHSPWVARTLTELGHEVIVANPSAMFGRAAGGDATIGSMREFLARQGRADVELLYPIRHRSADGAAPTSALLRARDQLVQRGRA